ncbi:hypothetical protein SO802_011515 [Lithocarpus litseifolius]|uniref:Uncharacterized protein n=1 Tax=Lithocarpus litseifolius TaxID=425828 RepID=A0AAW2D2T9_9ROSI
MPELHEYGHHTQQHKSTGSPPLMAAKPDSLSSSAMSEPHEYGHHTRQHRSTGSPPLMAADVSLFLFYPLVDLVIRSDEGSDLYGGEQASGGEDSTLRTFDDGRAVKKGHQKERLEGANERSVLMENFGTPDPGKGRKSSL